MNVKYEDIPHEKFKTDNGMDNINFSNIKNKNNIEINANKENKRNKVKKDLHFDESIKITNSLENNNLEILKSNKLLFEEKELINVNDKKTLDYQITKSSNNQETNKYKIDNINKGITRKIKFKTNSSIKKSYKKSNNNDNILTYRQLSFQHLKEQNITPILVFKRSLKKSSKKDIKTSKSSFKTKKVVFLDNLVNEKAVKSVKYIVDNQSMSKTFDEEKVICKCGCAIF